MQCVHTGLFDLILLCQMQIIEEEGWTEMSILGEGR